MQHCVIDNVPSGSTIYSSTLHSGLYSILLRILNSMSATFFLFVTEFIKVFAGTHGATVSPPRLAGTGSNWFDKMSFPVQ